MDRVTDLLATLYQALLGVGLAGLTLILAAAGLAVAFGALASVALIVLGSLGYSVALVASIARSIAGGLRESAAHTRALHAWYADHLLSRDPLRPDATTSVRPGPTFAAPLSVWVATPESGIELDWTVSLAWVDARGQRGEARLRWTYGGEDATLDLDAGGLTTRTIRPGDLTGFRAPDGRYLHLWLAAPDVEALEVRVERSTPASFTDVEVRCFRGLPPPP
jgi:hypothetical protein